MVQYAKETRFSEGLLSSVSLFKDTGVTHDERGDVTITIDIRGNGVSYNVALDFVPDESLENFFLEQGYVKIR